MTARNAPLRLLTTGAILAAGSLAFTACSSGGSSASGGAPNPSASVQAVTSDAKLAAMVPADIRSSGTIVIGTDATYAPNEFKDASGRIVGMDVDLVNAIAAKLGLKTSIQDGTFDTLIPGLLAKKYNISISSFTDNKDREKQVDMVDYFSAGSAIAVKAGNPDKIDPNDLCGVKVAVETGTVEADEVKNVRNPACQKTGKPGIPNNGDEFDAQTDATDALVSGRDQVMMADSPVVDYVLKQTNGQLEQLGKIYATAPYGIVVPKNDGQLAQAVEGAVQELMDNGTYRQILQKWGVQPGAIAKAGINGAQS